MGCIREMSGWKTIIVLVIVLAVIPAAVHADNYAGGISLTTIQKGIVSGGLYVDANMPDWGPQDVSKTFTPIPDVSTMQWARLYVAVYNGNMQNAYAGLATITFDGNNDGTYETTLGNESMNVPYSYPGDGGSGPVTVNDHCNRVTSDYLMWYDVKNVITSTTPKARVVITKVSPGFDGRIKMITLIVAYNDGDTDQVYYWVNQGHDVDTYYSEDNLDENYIGSTAFDLSGFSGTVDSARLTVNHLASTDGEYTFRDSPIPPDPSGGNYQGAYFGTNSWDVTSAVQTGTSNALTYNRGTANFYKIPLATLWVKKQGAPQVQPPVAAYTATPLTGTAPLTISFTDQSANTPASWKWEYRNASGGWMQFATTRNPSFTFSASGIYDIRLTATNAAGSDDETKTGYITVNAALAAPVAAFSAAPTTGTAPLTVSFTDQSTGTVTSRIWDFDNDGVTDSTAQNPVRTYTSAGSYTVNMTVTGPGGSDSERKIGYIIVRPAPPVAAFTATPRSGSPPLSVTFTDQSTNTPTTWIWEYKNASVDWTVFGTTKNPSYAFVTGTYDIRLNTTNGGGSDTETKTGYINVTSTSVPPTADFSADHTAGNVPLTVQFSDMSAGTVNGWAWDFNNDGSIDSTAQDPVYTYTTPGNYTVNMTVSGPGGTDSATKTGYITATSPPPVAVFSATPKSGYPPLTVTFTDLSTGTVSGWVWDFTNDGTIDSTAKNTSFTYTSEGKYTVNLTVTGPGGRSSRTDEITVSRAASIPVANFTSDKTRGSAPLTVKFNDKSSGSISSWAWDFNSDGTDESAGQNPSYTFLETGVYSVTLVVTGPGGSDSEKKTDYITVRGTPDCDLTIAGAVNPVASTVFAKEPNTIRIFNLKNNGPSASPATSIQLKASDGFTTKGQVPALASGENTTISLIDTTVRPSAGAIVTYNVTVDPDDDVAETDETNNVKQSVAKTVTYNGYKGKRFWDGSDVTTRRTFDLHGGLVHSFGDSVYRSGSFGSGGWTRYTVTWSPSDLAIPSNATVRQAVLYVPYTWDNSNEVPGKVALSFNGEAKGQGSWYHDQSNFGAYADEVYGLLSYDVTSSFKKNDQNAATFSRESSSAKLSMYGFTLAVIYEEPDAPRTLIFINEGFDLLGADEDGYATTPEEATAYVPFTGLTINTALVSDADLITFVASGDSEGTLLFNGNSVGSGVWDYGSSSGPQVAVNTHDVTSAISGSENTAMIQSTTGERPVMGAIQQFLVIRVGATAVNRTSNPLIANFSAEPLTGIAPLTVNFTDLSTGNPVGWKWDFDNNGIVDNTTLQPAYTYQIPGNYTVSLTVNNATSSNAVSRIDYIIVKNTSVTTPEPTLTPDTFLRAPTQDETNQAPDRSPNTLPVTSYATVPIQQHASEGILSDVMLLFSNVVTAIQQGIETLLSRLPFIGAMGDY